MDKVIEAAKEIRRDIDNLPEVQEYYHLKELYENDEELKRLREEIARLASLHKEEERKSLLKIYNSHPLVNNYNQAKEEVMRILNEVKNNIE